MIGGVGGHCPSSRRLFLNMNVVTRCVRENLGLAENVWGDDQSRALIGGAELVVSASVSRLAQLQCVVHRSTGGGVNGGWWEGTAVMLRNALLGIDDDPQEVAVSASTRTMMGINNNEVGGDDSQEAVEEEDEAAAEEGKVGRIIILYS